MRDGDGEHTRDGDNEHKRDGDGEQKRNGDGGPPMSSVEASLRASSSVFVRAVSACGWGNCSGC